MLILPSPTRPHPRALAKCKKPLKSANPSEPDFSQYRANPVGFITEKLGRSLTKDQTALCLSVRDNPETHCQAAHGIGKTFLAAGLAIWWAYAVGGLVITSAPTKRQVQELLWGEIRLSFGSNNLPRPTESGLTFFRRTETARGYGFTAAATNANGFQGIHNPKLLVILDEACGISQVIWDGAEACITGSDNRFLTLGNPIASGNPFSKACAKSNIRIPVWNHPNVKWAYDLDDDGIHRLKSEVAALIITPDGKVKSQSHWPVHLPKDQIPGAVSISWIENKARPKGETSAWWQSRVEGLFPTDSAQSIIPRSWFLAARARYDLDPDGWESHASAFPRRSGLDVGDGGDAHALATFRGSALTYLKVQDTIGDREDVTRAAVLGKSALVEPADTVNVDRTGVGSGSLAILLEQGYRAYGIHFGEKAIGTDGLKISNNNWNEDPADPKYNNLKAQLLWELREAFRLGEIAVAPLGDQLEEMLMEEFAAIYWDETSSGKIRIEDKKLTKARLGRSPNAAESAAMAWKRTHTEYRSARSARLTANTLLPRAKSRGIF